MSPVLESNASNAEIDKRFFKGCLLEFLTIQMYAQILRNVTIKLQNVSKKETFLSLTLSVEKCSIHRS